MQLRALLREPALLVDAFESLVVVLIALGVLNLHGDMQTTVVGLFIAALALVKGFLTKPFPVTVLPDLGRAVLVFCASWEILHVNADQITIIVTFLGTLMTVVQRAQITPRNDAVVHPQGSGSGPLAGRKSEGGYADLAGLGWALIVLGLILVLVSFVTTANLLWVGVVLLVVGLCVILVSGISRRPRV